MTPSKSTTAKNTMVRVKKFALDAALPALTGIGKSVLEGGGDIVQAASNAIQRSRKQNFCSALRSEFQVFVDKGKINPQYLQEEEGQMCLQELMDYLDKEPPDQRKFSTLKRIFFKAASAHPSEWQNRKPHQYMVVCRKLSSDEIALLSIAYKYSQKMKVPSPSSPKEITGAEQWSKFLAQESAGALTQGLVDHFEETLIKYCLIGDRAHTDKSGIRHSRAFRLAPLGLELCEFLESSEL